MTHPIPVRVAILQNLPAPNRLPIFDRLLEDPDLEVAIFFTGKPGRNRPSYTRGYREADSRIMHLPGIGIPFKGTSGDSVNVNCNLTEVLRWRPDVIVLYSYQDPTNMMIAFLARLTGIPYIICAEVSHVWNQSKLAKAFLPVVRTVLRNASILVAGSDSCAKYFVSQGVNVRKIVTIQAFAQYAEISSTAKLYENEAKALRTKRNMDDRFVLLFVGRLVAYKGVEELLLAASRAWQSRPDIVLVVVGTGPMKNLVLRYSELFPDNVLYLESVDFPTLVQLYSISDVHIMPSWHEAYGLVCGEALAAGTPSIVTKTSGCSDLIIDGVNGILIEPKNPDLLFQAILRLAQNPDLSKVLRQNAQASVSDYTVERATSSLKGAIYRARGHDTH